MAICKPESRSSPDIQSAGRLMLDIPPLRTVRNTCLFSSHTVYGILLQKPALTEMGRKCLPVYGVAVKTCQEMGWGLGRGGFCVSVWKYMIPRSSHQMITWNPLNTRLVSETAVSRPTGRFYSTQPVSGSLTIQPQKFLLSAT